MNPIFKEARSIMRGTTGRNPACDLAIIHQQLGKVIKEGEKLEKKLREGKPVVVREFTFIDNADQGRSYAHIELENKQRIDRLVRGGHKLLLVPIEPFMQ